MSEDINRGSTSAVTESNQRETTSATTQTGVDGLQNLLKKKQKTVQCSSKNVQFSSRHKRSYSFIYGECIVTERWWEKGRRLKADGRPLGSGGERLGKQTERVV